MKYGDLISRQDFDKCLEDAEKEAVKNRKYVFASALNMIRGNLRNLPSAEPERKTGRWITKLENNTYECSECGNGIITNKDYLKKHKFCFCCGAKLRGEQDE